MRNISELKAVIFAATLAMLPGSMATASPDKHGPSTTTGHAWVFLAASDGAQADLSLSLAEFETTFGDLDVGETANRDESESIIPTPGAPGPSGSWQAGDRVQFFRDTMQGGFYYSRITVYQFQTSGAWYRLSNNFRQATSMPPGCTLLPCFPSNPQ